MNRVTFLTLALILLGASSSAFSHRGSDSYLHLDFDVHPPTGRWQVALRDLENAIGVDTNGDGEITWGELRRRHQEVADFVLSSLHIRRNDAACWARPGLQQVERRDTLTFNVLDFTLDCERSGDHVGVHYKLLFDMDPTHRGLARITLGSRDHSRVFSPERPSLEIRSGTAAGWQTFLRYWQEGVWHISGGFDHLLFLLVLLLPSVLVRARNGWQPRADPKSTAREVLGVITAFTLAHSLTLTMAALGLMEPPANLVEPLIALTVLLAAVNNLWPVLPVGRARLAFGLGLVHGLGFAGALLDLGLPTGARVISLAGFNLGVETGQLLVAGFALPLAYRARNLGMYRVLALRGGSIGVAVLSFVWLGKRLSATSLLPL